MTALMESYSKLYEQIKQIENTIKGIDAQITALSNTVDFELPEKIKNLKRQIELVDEYGVKVDQIRVNASKHVVSRNIQTITPRPLNLNKLKFWSTQIDPDLKDDPYAQRIYVMCECNLLFLKQKQAEYEEELETLQGIDIVHAQKTKRQLEQDRKEAVSHYSQVLTSEDFEDFKTALYEAHGKWEINKLPEHYEKVEEDEPYISPGAVAYPFEIPKEFAEQVESGLGTKYYDRYAGIVWIPMELESDKEQVILIQCSNAVENRIINKGLQNFLYRIMNESATGNHKIYFMDALHYNTTILGPLKVLENTEVMEKLPRNPETVVEQLGEIIANFSDYDEILGLSDSVSDFNKLEDTTEKLSRTTLFLLGYPKAFPKEAQEKIQRILVNHERYGVTVVVLDMFSEKNGVEYKDIPEYIVNNAVRIVMNQDSHTYQKGEDGKIRGYIWYGLPQTIEDTYVEDIKQLVSEKKILGNVYPKRVPMEEKPQYTRGKKDLNVPVAVDQRGEIHSVSFQNENFAHYLMGASGSGKSTLLHNIITGVINNYHPDDVELWLADFKMSEFAQYIDPMPPHVKYILLDESQELVYDLIDKLTEKMMERQRFFMQHREMKKVENVDSHIYMPVILVILDEFSIMSQSIAESDSYKLKLQNLLAKGRALGIKFIFSSQTFIKGIAGLTPTAKDQIQTRIAMKNSFDEINETLELSTNTRTDQVRNWMEALPPHYILMKYREADKLRVDRLQVMYFDGKAEAAMEPQRKLIRSIQSMRVVDESEYAKDVDSYVDKKPVVVDGNAFDKFEQAQIDACIDDYKAKNSKDLVGDEMYVAFGTPRLMIKNKIAVMSNETRENILLVARSTEQSLAMSIILSTMKEVKSAGQEVCVWAYGRNRMYMANKSIFESGEYQVVEGIDKVCDSIKALKEEIQNRQVHNRLIVLVGIDRICADFELLSGDGKVTSTTTQNYQPSGVEMVAIKSKAMEDREKLIASGAAAITTQEQAQDAELAIKWSQKRRELKKQYKSEGKSKEEIDELINQEKEKFFGMTEPETVVEAVDSLEHTEVAENTETTPVKVMAEPIGKDTESVVTEPVVTETVVTEPVVTEPAVTEPAVTEPVVTAPVGNKPETSAPKTETGSAYNAAADFAYILKQGSRMGNHFLLLLNNFADLKQCGVKADLFRHKMAFQISVDDSRNMFNNRIASKLPEHICQYDDSYESYSFRPYLHQGLSWDGWTIDERGEIVNPMTIGKEE